MKKYIIPFHLLCCSSAMAASNRDLLNVFWYNTLGSVLFLVFVGICTWLLKGLIHILKKLLDSVSWAESKELFNKFSIKKKNINPRNWLTVLVVYEIVIIFILADDGYYGACESVFSFFDICDYNGFQYLIMCVFVPIVFGLLLSWRQEIRIFFKRLWYVVKN